MAYGTAPAGKTVARMGTAAVKLVAWTDGMAYDFRTPKSGLESSITTEGRGRLKIGLMTLALTWSDIASVATRTTSASAPRARRRVKRRHAATMSGPLNRPGSVSAIMMGSSAG